MASIAEVLGGTAPTSPDPAVTPQALKRRREALAAALAKAGQIQPGYTSIAQPIAQGVNALVNSYLDNQAAQQEAAGAATSGPAIGRALASFGTGGPVGAPPPAAAQAPAGGTANPVKVSNFDPKSVPSILASAGTPYGISPDYLTRTAYIESRFDPNASNPSGAKGMFQFVPSTAKQYALTNPYDPAASADAAARLAADNRASLQSALGRDPTDAELYLAHQQGAGGAAKLLANPNARAGDIVGDKAVRSNGGDPNGPASAFSGLWTGKFNNTQPRSAQADMPAPGAQPVSADLGNGQPGFVIPGGDTSASGGPSPAALASALSNGPIPAPSNTNDATIAALTPANQPAPNTALIQALDPSALGQDQGADLAASFSPQPMGPPQQFDPGPMPGPMTLNVNPSGPAPADPVPQQVAQAAPPLPPPRPTDLAVDPRADMPAPGAQETMATLPATTPAAASGAGLAQLPGPPLMVSNPADFSNSNDAGARAFAADASNRGGVPAAVPPGFAIPPGGPATTGAIPTAQQPVSSAAPATASAPVVSTQAAAGATPNAAQANTAQVQVAQAAPGQDPGAIAAMMANPWVPEGVKTAIVNKALTQGTVTHIDLGDSVGLIDARGRQVGSIPKTKNADFGEVGRDADGNAIMGFRNYGSQTVKPVQAGSGAAATDMNGNPIPAGVSPKIVRETQSKSYANDTVPVDPKTVAEVRQEVLGLPSYKNIKQASPVYRAMLSTAGTDTKASDLNLIYGMGKIMDPGSVVREGEMALAQGTSGLDDRLKGFANSVFGGARLTPETRASLLAEAHGRIKSYEDEFNVDADHYRGIAKRGRMNAEDVVPTFEPMKPWEPPAKAAPSAPPDRATVEQELRRRGLVK